MSEHAMDDGGDTDDGDEANVTPITKTGMTPMGVLMTTAMGVLMLMC